MYPDFKVSNVVDSIAFHTLGIWDEPRIISKYKNGCHGDAWETYTVSEQAGIQCRLAIAWIRLGLIPQDRVAIMAINRPRWIFTINSLLKANLVAVPIYPTLTAPEAAFILRDSGAKHVVVDTFAQAQKIASVIDTLPDLQHIYIMDKMDTQPEAPICTFDSLLESVTEHVDAKRIYERVRKISPDGTDATASASAVMDMLCERMGSIIPDDTAVIIYTSGTTGVPKGAVLSHQNLLSQRPIQKGLTIGPDDIFLNHLPFCHAFGLTTDLFGSVEMQATLVIADGILPEQIRHALHTIRPTVLMSVPRFFEKIYIQVHQVMEQRPKIVRRLVDAAIRVGNRVHDLETSGHDVPLRLQFKHRLFRRITNKVLRQAGLDRVRRAFAGGAPMSRELCLFFQGLGVPIYQGYGLTEASPVVSVNLPGRNKLGTVGPPIAGVEVKIAEDGEILVRGECVMKGYFNNPTETAQAIDGEGWLHTGDIGELDTDGYLRITDRKKELIVTSAGKNIAPIAVESAFNTDRYIDRVILIGEGRNYLAALVVPDFDCIRDWAIARGLNCRSNQDIAAHPAIRNLLEERIALVNERFARFEQIKKFVILDHPLSVETGEITPTEKLKRRVIMERYRSIINAIYE